MATDQTTEAAASYARGEGCAAHEAGVQYRDCPYIRGEDRWAWQQGWIASEVDQRRRIAAMP